MAIGHLPGRKWAAVGVPLHDPSGTFLGQPLKAGLQHWRHYHDLGSRRCIHKPVPARGSYALIELLERTPQVCSAPGHPLRSVIRTVVTTSLRQSA